MLSNHLAPPARRVDRSWSDGNTQGALALKAYDKTIGLQLSEVAVDCCLTEAPCGDEKAGRNPVDRGKQGIKRSTVVDAKGVPLGAVAAPANRHDSPLLDETLDTLEVLGELPEQMRAYTSTAAMTLALSERS